MRFLQPLVLLAAYFCGSGAVGPAGDPEERPKPGIRGWDVDRDDQGEFEAEYWGKIAKRMKYVEEVESQPEMKQMRKLLKQLAKRGYQVEVRVK